MFLLTKDKTSWKYILILVILAIVVGGVILWWVKKSEEPETAIRNLIQKFYEALENQNGELLMSYFTPPETPKEKESYEWLTGADLLKEGVAKELVYRVFKKVKISNPQIYEIKKIEKGKFLVTGRDEIHISKAPAYPEEIETISRKVSFVVVKIGDKWMIDKYKWEDPTKIYRTEKYSGFGHEEIIADLTNWKTYRNEEYGFEIKYPKEWKLWIIQPDEFSPYGDWGKQIGLAIFQSRVMGKPYCEFHLAVYSNPKNLSIRDFWRARLSEGLSEVYRFKSSNNIIFGEDQIPGVKFSMERADQPLPKESIAVITKKDGNIIELSWWGDPAISNQDCLKADQMLSTFRFLEQDETANWKTYRNEEYGFEIKHPSYISPTTTPNDWADGIVDPKGNGKLIVNFIACQFSKIPPKEPYHSFTGEIRIRVNPAIADTKNCLNLPLEFPNMKEEKANINDIEFKKFSEIEDAAMGKRLRMEVYRTLHNNACFSIEKVEHGYLFDELERPSSSHFDLESTEKFNSCRKILDQMLSTFRFLE